LVHVEHALQAAFNYTNLNQCKYPKLEFKHELSVHKTQVPYKTQSSDPKTEEMSHRKFSAPRHESTFSKDDPSKPVHLTVEVLLRGCYECGSESYHFPNVPEEGELLILMCVHYGVHIRYMTLVGGCHGCGRLGHREVECAEFSRWYAVHCGRLAQQCPFHIPDMVYAGAEFAKAKDTLFFIDKPEVAF